MLLVEDSLNRDAEAKLPILCHHYADCAIRTNKHNTMEAVTNGDDASVYGCEHYKRKCKIVASCCGDVVSCRYEIFE